MVLKESRQLGSVQCDSANEVCDYDGRGQSCSNTKSGKLTKSGIHFSLQRIRDYNFPYGFCSEFKSVLKLALPIAVTSLLTFTFGPVSIAFCGHLGQTELASIGLANAIFNMAGIYVVSGLLTAGDTIFAQTYGSKNKERISVQGKKTLVIMTLCCIPCFAFYLCVEPFLLVIGQNPEIAKLTSNYLLRLIPCLLLQAWGQILLRYIQTQNHVYIPLVIVALTNGINAAMHYIFLYWFQMGINGSALAQATSYLFQNLCFVVYIQFSRNVISLTSDNSIDYLRDWSAWMRLGFPGFMMYSMEGALFELGGFVAGSLGELELAVQTILITLDTITYNTVPAGFGAAVGIRVGQYLGGGMALGPRSTLLIGLLILWFFAPIYFGLTLGLKEHIPKIFTSDPDVLKVATQLIPLISVFQIVDAINGICGGVLRGAGQQRIGAGINIASLYFVGAPISACLVYVAKFNLKGLWIGLITGATLQMILYLIICFRMNWDKQAKLALERLQTQKNLDMDEILFLEAFTDEGKSHEVKEEVAAGEENDRNKEMTKVFRDSVKTGKSLLCEKGMIIVALLVLLCGSICFRIFFPLSNYFGPYCMFSNGTYVKGDSSVLFGNCTIFIP